MERALLAHGTNLGTIILDGTSAVLAELGFRGIAIDDHNWDEYPKFEEGNGLYIWEGYFVEYKDDYGDWCINWETKTLKKVYDYDALLNQELREENDKVDKHNT